MSYIFNPSLRIITLEAPNTEIPIQELYDAIREWECCHLEYPYIAEGSGKQDLGGGVRVGVTVVLHNWKVKFEDRAGPTWTVCNITGGNLVSIDDISGITSSPIESASFVTTTLTSASSATLTDIEAIQYAMYNDGITIDTVNGTDSSEYPYGTAQYPCKTMMNVSDIYDVNRFINVYVYGDLTLDYPYGPIHDIITYGMLGKENTKVTIVNTQLLNKKFVNVTLEGTCVDSDVIAEDCDILDLSGVKLTASKCYLKGTIQLTDSGPSNFNGCFDGIPGSGTPIIDVNTSLAMGFWGYIGGLKITNMTLATELSLNLNPGRVLLDTSCTAGAVIIRGIGTLVDQTVGNPARPTINQIGLLDLDYLAHAVWDEPVAAHATADTFGANLTLIKKIQCNRWKIIDNQMIIYDDNGSDVLLTLDLKNGVGAPSMTDVYERVPV